MLRTSRVFCYEIVTKCRALSRKRQSRLCEVFRPLLAPSARPAAGAGYEKPSVFIRSDVHAVRAGMNIRGCAPLSTPGGERRLRAGPGPSLPIFVSRYKGILKYRQIST